MLRQTMDEYKKKGVVI